MLNKIDFRLKLLLVGTFIISASYWMTWPFLAVILYKNFHLLPATIGLIISSTVIGSTLMGIYFGHLSDKLGRAKLMLIGCIAAAVGFLILGLSISLKWYCLSMMLISIARALLDPMSKAIFSDFVDKSSDRAYALHVRYFVVNLGAAFGPLIGVYFGIAQQRTTFFITAFSYVLYLTLILPILIPRKNKLITQTLNDLTFSQTLKILVKDKAFMLLIVVNILTWIVFVQFESTLAVYFSVMNAPNLLSVVSLMILTNTLTIISLQFPLLKWMKHISLNGRIYISIFLLAVSQVLFAYSPMSSITFWIFSTIIFSISETILVPNLNVVIDLIAPPSLKGAYFAASFLYRIGSGAFIGGLLLQAYGGRDLFLVMFAICILMAVLYALSVRLFKPLIL